MGLIRLTQINNDQLDANLEKILIDGEKILKGFKAIRDIFAFTDKRLIAIDKQGLTGKKQEYHSIPYKSISHFSVETAGHLDLDAELKIYISSQNAPIYDLQFKDDSILEIQKSIAKSIL